MIKTTVLLCSLAISSLAIAAPARSTSIEYDQTLSQIAQLETTLAACIPTQAAEAPCYFSNKEKYDKIIRDIRAKHAKNVNPQLWQAINIGFKKRLDQCKDKFFDMGPSAVFFPYLDCQNSAYHTFALTTAKLHLAQ